MAALRLTMVLALIAFTPAASVDDQQEAPVNEEPEAGVLLLQARRELLTPDPVAANVANATLPAALANDPTYPFYHLPDDPTFNLSIEFQFLHIGKTGGSTLRNEFAHTVDLQRAEMLGHSWSQQATATCSTRQPRNKYVFFVRAPVSRYVSAYISRLDYGAPGKPGPDWSAEEKAAFEAFTSPDELGCALGSSNYTTRRAAQAAIMTIGHTSLDLERYWNGIDNLRKCSDQVWFVGRTEYFDDDLDTLRRKLGEENVMLGKGFTKLAEHTQPAKYDNLTKLSSCAVKNLRLWYHKDYEIIDYLASIGKLPASYPDEVRLADDALPTARS